MSTYRIGIFLRNLLLYITLTFFALVMLFPFLVMLFTSLKEANDTYRFPPKLLPRAPITMEIEGFESLNLNQFDGSESVTDIEQVLLDSGYLTKTSSNKDFKVSALLLSTSRTHSE